ncbi:MAG TPA: VWA domain-containing protein [Acidobacteriota bacterium]|jgi:VWFA-related protein
MKKTTASLTSFFILSILTTNSRLPIFAQQEKQPSPVFRITSSRVRVDFVAVDKQGRFVNDLRSNEVEIYEDGKKQNVDVFYAPGESRQKELVSPGGAGAAGTGVASSSGPATALANAAKTIIVIDSRTIDSNNFVHSVAAIRNFVERHLTAGHAVMIAEVYRGLRVLTPMTRDKATLLAGVDKLKPQSVYNPLDASRVLTQGYFHDLELQITDLREALTVLCYSLAGQAGRKHVVFFSEGYPIQALKLAEMQMREAVSEEKSSAVRQAAAREVGRYQDPNVLGMVRDVVSAANNFGISFYTVDARGLIALQGVGSPDKSGNVAAGPGAGARLEEQGRPDLAAAARSQNARASETEVGPSEQIVATFNLTALSNLDDAQNTLIALAAGTNGLAFYHTNNLGIVLSYSATEQENYYLASYIPNAKRKTGQFHTISVRAARPGIFIRSRMGYVDIPEDALRNARLSSALRHPELFGQIAPLLQIEPSKGKTRVVTGIPGSQVEFRQDAGKYAAQVSFLGMVYDSNGKPISKDFSINKGFNLALTPEQFQGLGNNPLLSSTELNLSSGRYRLVLLVEDRLGGSLGASVQEFQVP